MAEYSGESGFVQKVRKKTDEAAANGLPVAAGIANAAFQFNGQDVVKRVSSPLPSPSPVPSSSSAVAPLRVAAPSRSAGETVSALSQIGQNLASSPLVQGAKFLGRNTAAAAALPFTATSDVLNKGVNGINKLLGGSPGYLRTDSTQQVLRAAQSDSGAMPAGNPPAAAAPQPVTVPPAIATPAVTLAAQAKNGQVQPATPVIAGGKPKQAGQQDITVDQYLTNLSADQAAGRQTGKMPRGVTGSVQVVGDLADESFKPGAKHGAVLTQAGYYTGSDFGNSPLSQGGGKTRLSDIAVASDQANQFRQQRQAQAVNRPQQIAGPSVEDYLNKIDPIARSLAPMKALRLATEARNNDIKTALVGQDINQKAQQHGAELQQKREDLDARKPVYDAQARSYGAHAKLYEAQSSPEYLMRQERVAAIKDQATREKEMKKLQHDMATKWVKGQTGMEHPDDIKAALLYIGAQDSFNQGFDAFVDKLAPSYRRQFVDGFKSGDQAVLEQLARRGIVRPQPPAFPTRNPSTLGLQSEVK